MRIKRKITKINDSAADAIQEEAQEPTNTTALPVTEAGTAPANARSVKAKSADINFITSPGSSSSNSSPDRTSVPTSSSNLFENVPSIVTPSFTGLGKKHKKTKKTKAAAEGEEEAAPPKKRWTKRPEHWRKIAEFYKNNSLEATLIAYHDELGDFSSIAQYHKLHSWKKELENDIDIRIQPPGREPAYGNELDARLLESVMDLLQAGNPVDDATLRNCLVELLTAEGRSDLLIENGGTCVFQTSWAARFWKRHEAHVKEIRLQNIAAQTGVPQARPGRAAKPLQQQLAELDPNADPAETAKKPWTRRPDNWMQMAEYFSEHGISNALVQFQAELGHLSYSAAYQKLNNWRNDMVTQRELHSPGRPPNYGEMVDNQLLAIVQDRIATGQSVDDHVMREILVDLLTAVGKETLLRENGGECTFGHSWAVRFRKRHNLPTKDQNARKRKRVLATGEEAVPASLMAPSAASATLATATTASLPTSSSLPTASTAATTSNPGSAAMAAITATATATAGGNNPAQVDNDDDDSDDEDARIEFLRK